MLAKRLAIGTACLALVACAHSEKKAQQTAGNSKTMAADAQSVPTEAPYRQQYYDGRADRYYYYDAATHRYYWEDGRPRG